MATQRQMMQGDTNVDDDALTGGSFDSKTITHADISNSPRLKPLCGAATGEGRDFVWVDIAKVKVKGEGAIPNTVDCSACLQVARMTRDFENDRARYQE